ncbi:VWA domain-containing protein [Telmatobacter sp. DSM 110680]|uniref:VWA domain-containing protein n=1 Tax=Telmatobacter sp. DSM 110680 TaxID=3036704 RepID=A0AAU7DM45_9BACT
MGKFSVVILASAVSLLGGFSIKGAPQSPSSSAAANQAKGEYVFRSDVRRVPLDVIVLDKDGNPVHGLTEKDFVVEEDKKPQTILTFDYTDGRTTAFTPPKIPALPANTFVDLPTGSERGPLYVLYYDMVNTPVDDQMMASKQLLSFVDHAQPGTRFALFVNMAGLHLVQGFTSDHTLLHEAILSKGPGPHVPNVFMYGNLYGWEDAGAVLSNMKFMAQYLGGIPGRKNLLWLSSEFPIPVGPIVTGLNSNTGVGGGFSSSTLQINDMTYLEAQGIKEAYAAMASSQVALYPVDLEGQNPENDPGDQLVKGEYENAIAEATGGHAYHGGNRLQLLLDKAVEDGESYYSLTYSPTNTKYDGSERHIRVTLAEKDKKYSLTYRTVYYGLSDDEALEGHSKQIMQQRFLAAKQTDTLYATVEHGAPMMHDVLFVAHMATVGKPRLASAEEMKQLEDSPLYFKTRRKAQTLKPPAPVNLQQYVINYDVIDPQLRSQAAQQQAPQLEFAAAAYNSDGTLLNSILNKGVITIERQPDGKVDKRFHAIQQLEVPPGGAYIRLVVRNPQNDRTGALEVKLPLKQEAQTAALNPEQKKEIN